MFNADSTFASDDLLWSRVNPLQLSALCLKGLLGLVLQFSSQLYSIILTLYLIFINQELLEQKEMPFQTEKKEDTEK